MTEKYSNHFYNKNLQPNANRLRKEMTKAEACLWKYVLRAGKMKGYPFRRQLLGDTESGPTRNDRHTVHRVSAWQ